MSSPSLPPHNLPLQLTSLVGRERETAAVSALLRRDDVRLLTLTGAPGIGKTRLGVQVAASLLPEFADGAFFVNLAPITDPNLVITSIVYALGVRQIGDQSLLQCLRRFLAERQLLLLLDNFEQVVEAAPQIAEVLQAAPGLKVLVTSRELLHLSGEHNFPVPPLSLPPVLTDHGSVRALAHLTSERIAQYEAVQLFAQRARALNPEFTLTESNALAVAAICSRLDGLPLSIELAAARIQHLPPQAVLDRLQHPEGTRLRLLTGGTQDMPARQRTLRATIEWSYNLLNEDEQRLFRRLGVFQGGSTLDAIEAVCNPEDDLGVDVLDAVRSLVDKSLLRPEYGAGSGERHRAIPEHPQLERPEPDGTQNEPYFAMLETIHEFAREQLDAGSEAERIRRYHAFYFLMLAQTAEPKLRGPDQADWLNRLDVQRENLRAALDWAARYEPTLGLQLAARLCTYWVRRSHFSEGQARLSTMLARARSAGIPAAEAVAHALYALGFITWHQGDLQAARSSLEESVRIYRKLQLTNEMINRTIMAESLNMLGIVVGRLERIPVRRGLHEEALGVGRNSGDNWSIARSLFQLGHVGRLSGDYDLAQSLFEESLSLFRASGDQFNIGLALIGAGLMSQQHGDFERAHSLFEEAYAIYRALGVPWAVASSQYCLGSVALDQGDYASARSFLSESIALQREMGTMGDIAEGLENLGRAAYFQGDYAAAHDFYAESLSIFRELGDRYGVALCLMDLAGVVISGTRAAALKATHSPARKLSPDPRLVEAVRVLGAAQALLESIGIQLNQTGQKLLDIYISAARSRLGERPFAEALAAGRAMDIESAILLAQTTPPPQALVAAVPVPATPGTDLSPPAGSLTRRERDIATFLAQGKSNRQIADALIMSERTVEWHTSNILSKLGFQSRAQIAVWAVDQGLTASL